MATFLKINSKSPSILTTFSTLKHHFSSLPTCQLNSHFLTTPLAKTLNSLNPTKPFFSNLSFSTKSISSSSSSSDYESSDIDSEEKPRKPALTKEFDNSKLPPPYDPFNKNPVIREPEDPKNLQQIFHDIRNGDGLFNFAAKMFDGLSQDGLTREALQLFSVINEKGSMPDVVAHTAVVDAYVNAGQAKEGLNTYLRMVNCGIKPNAYTYSVLVKGLALSGDKKLLKEAKKIVVEMMGKGVKVNAGTCVVVFQAFVKTGNVEEGKEFFEVMKGKGFVADEKEVREVLKGKRGPEFRGVMDILFGK
ncbi:Pentatricopeptide repeat-containing protein [Heracleum sosnowskyi]|uniref:Pentatricopeptide repeat-containing protein n=1 Tax=Heracleum sosnowskyi TaxID=360622 RepID=A0AAD8MF73_9APIA|nr:Pentatricopeptide repeat-containing protein [Heracleum sosnowskyi]